jgi:hypothetical protein
MGARHNESVRIQTGDQLVEIPWKTAQELRGRLLASGLDSLDDQFAAKGTSAPQRLAQRFRGASRRTL